jgi:hypothetical protein
MRHRALSGMTTQLPHRSIPWKVVSSRRLM